MTASESRGTSQLRRRITVAGVILIVLIVGADSYEAWQDFRNTLDVNQQSQTALSRAFADQTARMIQQVDTSLAESARWAVSADGRAADEQSMRERLRSEFMRLPFVHSASIVGSDGHVRAGTSSVPIANRSLFDCDVFSVPQQVRSDVLHIGCPRIGRRDGSRTFAVSRRMENAGHEFAGIVVARIEFDYLAGFYAGVNITPGTSVRLARSDGMILAQYPKNDQAIVKAAEPGAPPAGDIDDAIPAAGAWASNSKQTVASEAVAGYPIVIEVRRSAVGIIRPWVQQEISSAARTLPLAILTSVLLISLLASLRRRDRLDEERRRLEQELASAQRADALGFLAAAVAHDFNNVLSAIVGYAELARNSVPSSNPALTNLDRLLAAAERARQLVKRVLTFDTHRSVRAIPVPVAPIVEEIAHQLQATIPAAVRIETLGLELDPAVRGDPTEIYQILINLCSNAVKAMPAGGTLQIKLGSLDVAEPRAATIGRLRPGSWVSVTVGDSGDGLPAEQIENVFEPFYTTWQQGEGSGIGLTVVRNIVLSMGGALDVHSEPGVGTLMCVYLPQVHAPVLQAMPPSSPGHGQTILVVDDDAELVALAEEVLASLGYEPVGFGNARMALDAFQREPGRFDAVLTDERMTPMKGIDLAKAIHQINSQVPIILMTGHRDAELESSAGDAGVVEILDKPLRAQTLENSLGRWLLERATP